MSDSKSGANHPMFGKTHTPESKAQMSNAHTGKTHTPETLVKISASMTGKTQSDETRGDPPSGCGTPLIPPSQGRRGGRGCYNNGGGGLSMISYYQNLRGNVWS